MITAAGVVDQCDAITVPPFGHAELVTEDKSSGLALIRLYGARNLAPAPLADNTVAAGEVTLIGLADPLAEAGDMVTAVPARLSASALEPAPKLGFSGAAVADARGRLVGMVDLRPAAMAGAGVATAVAMVPVEIIRAFLQAQHIASAATDNAAINQSLLRVICVRK